MLKLAMALATGAVVAAGLNGCGEIAEAETRPASAAAGEQCVDANTQVYADDRSVDVDNVYSNETLASLRKLSSLVVSGTVTSVQDGVAFEDSRLTFAVVKIKPTETLKGTTRDEVQVVISSQVLNGHHFTVPGQPVPAVGACGVWFLAPVGAGSSFGGYAPVGPAAEILFDAEGRFTNHAAWPALVQAGALGTRDKILALLRSTP